MFNYWPDDAKILKMSGEHTLYESEQLSTTWGHCHVNFGTLTFESAAYVARYVTKKITGRKAQEHYTIEHEGELEPLALFQISFHQRWNEISRRDISEIWNTAVV